VVRVTNLLKLALGLLPVALAAIGAVVIRLRDRRTLRRSPELRAAINRHPSMSSRRAIYRADCGHTVYGADPLDLFTAVTVHQENCVEREVA